MPQLGIEPRPPGLKSNTLPWHCWSWLIQQGCTSVDKPHSTTYSSSIFRFVLESQRTFNLDTDMLRAHQMGYLPWPQMWHIVTGENAYHLCPGWESNPGRPVWNQTLYHVTVKAGSYSKAVQLLIYYSLLHIPLSFLDFFCLIWFFTSTQQSFSYAGQVFLGWTSTKLG